MMFCIISLPVLVFGIGSDPSRKSDKYLIRKKSYSDVIFALLIDLQNVMPEWLNTHTRARTHAHTQFFFMLSQKQTNTLANSLQTHTYTQSTDLTFFENLTLPGKKMKNCF